MVTDEQSCQWDIIISKDLIHRTLIDASASACSPCSNTRSIDVCTLLTIVFTGKLFHCYMLDKSICHFRGVGSGLLLLFLMENPVSKQCRP